MNQMVIHQHAVSDIERMAAAISKSNLFGVATVEQAVTLCLVAQAEGRHPASAAQDYHIIKGRPSKKADAMLRDFISGGGKIEWHQLDDTKADATFSHPAGGTVRIDWDMARAKMAGLSTDMWKKYPRQMLRARVVSEGVRTVYPMATSGMYVPEEVQEFEAPRQPAAAPAKTIEGEIAPDAPPPAEIAPPKSKAKSRDNYAALETEVDACATPAEIVMLFDSAPFQAEFTQLPIDWQNQLLDRMDEMTATLSKPPATDGYVPPDFDSLPTDTKNAVNGMRA